MLFNCLTYHVQLGGDLQVQLDQLNLPQKDLIEPLFLILFENFIHFFQFVSDQTLFETLRQPLIRQLVLRLLISHSYFLKLGHIILNTRYVIVLQPLAEGSFLTLDSRGLQCPISRSPFVFVNHSNVFFPLDSSFQLDFVLHYSK